MIHEDLPRTINFNDARYSNLGSELTNNLGRPNGSGIAIVLHAYFCQDIRDWLYNCIWPYFSAIPIENWSQDESADAEINCQNAISFFQSVRGAVVAGERGYVPLNKVAWYTSWLMRLNLGDAAAKQAAETWLPAFTKQNREEQLKLFTAALSQCLPKIAGQVFLLTLYEQPLDYRIQATTVRAFGKESEAKQLHSTAVSMEEKVRTSIHQYMTGGCEFYILENEKGMLITRSEENDEYFNIWTHAEYANEVNESKYNGTHSISTMPVRELERELKRMSQRGVCYVTLDRRVTGGVRVIPINEFLLHVTEIISRVENSDFGKTMKRVLQG